MASTAPPRFSPMDVHEAKRMAHVRPADWTNPIPSGTYNLVVIGAGTAGLVSAIGAAGLGARVALIEKHFMGGDCLNAGCVPSKAVISAARVARLMRFAGEFGVDVSCGAGVDFAKVMERMRRLRADISAHDSVARLQRQGVDVYLGEGRFTSGDTVRAGGRTLSFKKAVIATGARASAPPIPGLDRVDYLTNESIFSLTKLPKRLGIVGAGPIGCELAQSFANFGAKVTMIESAHGILPREDRDASKILMAALLRDGVNLLCCGKQTSIRQDADGIHIMLDSHDTAYDAVVDRLMIAVGRAPNVEHVGCDAAGVAYDEHGVKVNDRLQTSNPNIYAAGDVCSFYQFTHAADFMARIVIRNALFMGRAKASALTIPWCTYTFPEIAHVGLYESQAREKNIGIDTYIQDFQEVDRAILEGETGGFVKIHAAKGTDSIVGATIVSQHAGDMIAQITQAMKNKIGLKKIADTLHPYPTLADAIRQIGDQYNRTRLTPWVRRCMRGWLQWQRGAPRMQG